MAITVNINNISVAVTGSVICERNRREDPDYGHIVIVSTREARYEVGDIVDITDGVLTFQYIVQADVPVEQKAGLYEHDITLAEAITYFNKVYPVDRSFTTVPARTIREVLTAYIRELKFYHEITVALTDNAIYDTALPDKEYSGVNMTTVFYDVMRRIDAIPRITWSWLTMSWTLTHELYTASGSAVTVTSYDSKQTESNDIEYATVVKSQAKNTVTSDGIWIPSADGWMTPRPKGSLFRTSDLQYEFDSKIMWINKAVAKVACELYIQSESGYDLNQVTVNVDFTQACLPSDAYDALLVNQTVQNPLIVWNTDTTPAPTIWKQNAVYYSIGGAVLDGLFSKFDGVIFDQNIQSLRNAIYQFVHESTRTQYGYLIPDGYDWYVNPVFPSATEDIECRFQYMPMRDIDFTVEKHDVTGFNNSVMLTSQSDSKIELERYIGNVGAVAQRVGHRVTRLSKWFTAGETYWKLGDYANIGKIIDIRYTLDKTGVVCLADFAVGFSNINGEYAIAREPSPYTFTDRRVTSNYIYTQYLEFSKTDQTNDTDLTALSHRILLNLLDWSATYDVAMSVGNMIPLPLQEQFIFSRTLALNIPLVKSGNGNAIILHAQIQHPQIAGNGMRKDNGAWYKNPIQYVDEDNGMTEFRYILSDGYTAITDTAIRKFYPLVEIADNTYTVSRLFPADKDINAAWAMTYQIMCVTDSPDDIIIGQAFTRYNNFIMEHGTAPSVTLYVGTTPFTIFDRTIRSTDAVARVQEVALTGTTLTVASVDDLEYWALVYDDTDEIIIAGNNDTTTIYTNIKRHRDRMSVIADADDVEISLHINVEAAGYIPILHSCIAELENTISIIAAGTLQFNYEDDAEISLQFNVTASGYLNIPQKESGAVTFDDINISFILSAEKKEKYWATSDVTYYNTQSGNRISVVADTYNESPNLPNPSTYNVGYAYKFVSWAITQTGTSSPIEIDLTTLSMPNGASVATAMEAQELQYYDAILDGVFNTSWNIRVDDGAGYTYWRVVYTTTYYKVALQ